MADLTRTAANVSITKDRGYAHEIHSIIAGADLNDASHRGQAVYTVAATGRANLADGSASGTAGVRGIILRGGRTNEGISILKRGWLEGYDLDGLDYDDPVYLSDTAGELSDTAGTVSVAIGRVVASTERLDDGTLKKLLYVDIQYV